MEGCDVDPVPMGVVRLHVAHAAFNDLKQVDRARFVSVLRSRERILLEMVAIRSTSVFSFERLWISSGFSDG